MIANLVETSNLETKENASITSADIQSEGGAINDIFSLEIFENLLVIE